MSSSAQVPQQNSAAGCLGCLGLLFIACLIFSLFHFGWWVLVFLFVIIFAASKAPSSSPKQTFKSSKEFVDALKKICFSYSSDRYYVERLVPEDKLGKARSAFLIPPDEKIIALVDATVLSGLGDRGFAIGVNGIYWYNDNYSDRQKDTGKGLNWNEFATTSIKYKQENVIEIGTGNAFWISRTILNGRTLELLFKIQSLIKNPQFIPTSVDEWFIASSGQQFGPYDISTIDSKLFGI